MCRSHWSVLPLGDGDYGYYFHWDCDCFGFVYLACNSLAHVEAESLSAAMNMIDRRTRTGDVAAVADGDVCRLRQRSCVVCSKRKRIERN